MEPDLLHALQNLFVFVMGTNPEPGDRIAVQQPQRAIIVANSNGIDWPSIAYAFEVQTR